MRLLLRVQQPKSFRLLLEQSGVDYEPHVALFGGNDGLKFYRDVFEKAHLVLNEKSFLAFEMGWDQGEALSNLAREYFESATITVHKDMSGKDRMLTIELNLKIVEQYL